MASKLWAMRTASYIRISVPFRSFATVLKDLKYANSHEWVKVEGNHATVGITDHAQDHFGDVVYVELPDEGVEVEHGASFGAVESVKATSDINSPVSGKVVEVNTELKDSPGLPQHHDEHNPSIANPEPQQCDAVFDSSHFGGDINIGLNSGGGGNDDDDSKLTAWDEKYRDRVKSKVFGENVSHFRILEREEENKRSAGALAKSLLEPALDRQEEVEIGEVKKEDQKSLSVGIIGAPNAGKSALTNCFVGTKVSAVSRKVNTTTHEVLGVMTEGVTQMCFFDTPGLMLKKSGIPYRDIKIRNRSAWSSIELYDVLIVIFDVHRHVTKPDSRVVRLIERMGSINNPSQKRVLCLNKVDLVPKKNDLLRVAKEFKDMPGYDRHFMISGLKGFGVKDLTRYLVEQAVRRPWDEDPFAMSEEVMKNISLEVVREKLLDYVHQEIPYGIEHRLMGWKELRDGSLRIEQHFITPKMSQRKILVGSKGSKIGRIGMEANEELRSIFKRNVHLILMVRVK